MNEMSSLGTYLGDGVYIVYDKNRGMHKIFTHNGIEQSNIIYLENGVAENLQAYLIRNV